MSDRLIDTNILVYAYDSSEGKKHEVANELLKKIWQEGGGIVCLQNLMDFFVVITRKVKTPVTISQAKIVVGDFLKSENWLVIDRDEDTFLSAIDLVANHEVPFWDSMIASCMKENEITQIVTENKKDFEKAPDIKVSSPF